MKVIERVAQIPGITPNDLYNALKKIASFDDDMTGKSGPEYFWYQTWKENGYSGIDEWERKLCPPLKLHNNLEYILSELKNCESDEERIDTFFRIWMENDCLYGTYYYSLTKQDDRITGIYFKVYQNE